MSPQFELPDSSEMMSDSPATAEKRELLVLQFIYAERKGEKQ